MAKDQIIRSQPKLKPQQYEKELRRLQAELCHLQDWVKLKGLRIIVLHIVRLKVIKIEQ